MTIVKMAELMSSIYVGISLISQLSDHDKSRSTTALKTCTFFALLWTIFDMLAYCLKGPEYHKMLLWGIYLLANILGNIVFITFIRYCYMYITERTSMSRITLAFPVSVTVFSVLIISGYFLTDKIIRYENGFWVQSGTVPMILQILNILMLFYVPMVALSKGKEIGIKAVFFLSMYGFSMLLALAFRAVTGKDFTVSLGAACVVMVASLLQKDETQKKMEQINRELERSNHQLREYNNILSNAGYGIWHIILKEGTAPRMQVNQKMANLLSIDETGMTEEEIYDSWYRNVMPEAISSVQNCMEEMIGGKLSEVTYAWNHHSKGLTYVRSGGSAAKSEDGITIISGYHVDVTDLVLNEQKYKEQLQEACKRAEEANKAKTTFLFNMSHDIRTPMNAIVGFTDLIEKHYDEKEKCMDYLHKAQSANQFLLNLINNVLEMARIESGKIIVDETIFEVGSITREMTELFEEQMKKKNIIFTQEIDVHALSLYGDQPKIRELYLNILSNALKYTPNGGTIHLSLKELSSDQTGYVRMQGTVVDSGVGMTKEFLPHLFEEFSRARTATESRLEGTGLGMPIVKSLVELMKGTIEVESEVGKGTKVQIVLPLRIAETPVNSVSESSDQDMFGFEGKQILLAEDNDLNAEIAIEILSDLGLSVERAVDGIDCVNMLAKADAGYYNMILMDIQMPNLNGYDATRRIRAFADENKKYIPIVAMTANAFEEDKKDAFVAGMDGHLAKPVDISALVKTLTMFLVK